MRRLISTQCQQLFDAVGILCKFLFAQEFQELAMLKKLLYQLCGVGDRQSSAIHFLNLMLEVMVSYYTYEGGTCKCVATPRCR